MMTETERNLRILEAIAPIVAAKSSSSTTSMDVWRPKSVAALEELYEAAHRLVVADEKRGQKVR